MDCAETLVLGSELFEFMTAQSWFNDLKRIMSKVNKKAKIAESGTLIQYRTYGENKGYYKQGGIMLTFGNVINHPSYFSENLPIEFEPYVKPFVDTYNSKI